MSPLNLSEGTLFAGRYRVVRCLAHGGMGAVYEVIHLETERRRALKVMLPHLVQSAELRDRFRREARVAAQIESAYIVDVFDAGIDDQTGMPFLVMELLKGEEIGKRLERVGRLPYIEVVQYLWQTAWALDKTHKANIVHRDLKPENLFLHEQEDASPRIKVLDFGIAKIVAEQGTQANATRSVGTPLYMAPEQFKNGSQVFPATDIYSLGMVAYTLLVGAPYWQEEQRGNNNVFAFVTSVMHGPTEKATVRAARRGVTLPAAFDVWFAKVTNVMRDERYPMATAAIAALAEAIGVPIPGESSRTSHSLSMLQAEASKGRTIKMTPEMVASMRADELDGAPPGVAPAILLNAPPARPPLASVSGTAFMDVPAPPASSPGPPPSAAPSMQVSSPSLSGLPTIAVPQAPNVGPAQTGPEGALGVGVTRPTATPAKKSNTPVVMGIVGFVALIGIGGAIWGSQPEETQTTNANVQPKSTESVAASIAQSATPTASTEPPDPPPVNSASAAPIGSASAKAPTALRSSNAVPSSKPPPTVTTPRPTASPTGTSKTRDPRTRIKPL